MIDMRKPKVSLLFATPLIVAEVAARSCYGSFGNSSNAIVQKFGESSSIQGEDIDQSVLLDTLVNVYHHGSIAEHVNLTFRLQDISREVVLEMNRHRIGIATSQKSTRFTIDDLVNSFIEGRNTGGIQNLTASSPFYDVVARNIVHTSEETITATMYYLYEMLSLYDNEVPLEKNLTGKHKKAQNDRVKRALPESWLMDGVWTFNLRALKHFLKLRDSHAAYYGIREVATALKEATPHKYRLLIDKKYKEQQHKGIL